eukprot:760086-Rhodomonas_salina.1
MPGSCIVIRAGSRTDVCNGTARLHPLPPPPTESTEPCGASDGFIDEGTTSAPQRQIQEARLPVETLLGDEVLKRRFPVSDFGLHIAMSTRGKLELKLSRKFCVQEKRLFASKGLRLHCPISDYA